MNNNHFTPNPVKGILWVTLHALVFTSGSMLVRVLSPEIHIFQIFFLAMLIGFLGILPWTIAKKTYSTTRSDFSFFGIRGVLGTTGMLMWFYVLQIIPATEATALSYTTPLFSTIIAVWMLREIFNRKDALALILGFAGAMIVLRPGLEMIKIGAVLAIIMAIVWAFIDVTAKMQAARILPSNQALYVRFFMTLCSMPFALKVWVDPTLKQWGLILLIGVVFLINVITIFQAYRHASIVTLAPFRFWRLVFMAFFAWALFGETLDMWVVFGSVVILVGSTLCIKNQEAKSPKPA